MTAFEYVELVDSKGEPIDGLVSVRDHSRVDDPHERAILLQAAVFHRIDYVLFRRFADWDDKVIQSSCVVAYVVDNSLEDLDKDELAQLHHQLWLQGVAPLIYVAWPTRIDILSCARQPDFWRDGVVSYHEADRIEFPSSESVTEISATISDLLAKRRRFSAHRLVDGTFWEEPDNQTLAKQEAAAHQGLIQAIVEADRDLDGANCPMLRRLLILMVLIKYLEDRGVFPFDHFSQFHAGARSLRDVLRQGTLNEVLDLLRSFEDKFNGDVFLLGANGDSLEESDLKKFAALVEAETLGGQKHFWKLFSFEHIPVEVISRLYQQFVQGHGAVYTPPVLAALLLDQVMPYDQITGEEKILDPACGSGVFLVGAFKRLVVYWRSQNEWKKPSADELKEILTCSIHGVELESEAVDLTAFSLALAVCDALEPPVIWNSLKFDKLRGRNLREGDFFDQATFTRSSDHDWPESFDVIVGNPPFESKLTEAAKMADQTRSKDEPKLPDKQSAYLFLEHGLKLLALGGGLCLIQPHGLLYNSNSMKFRGHLMKLSRLDTVLDFVSMRGLYEGADPKTIAWCAVAEPMTKTNQVINHLTFRRVFTASERMVFEIDHYDWHTVSKQDALTNPFVWRLNLLGGGRLHDVSERLRKLRTLSELVSEKGWDFGEGFLIGEKDVQALYLTEQSCDVAELDLVFWEKALRDDVLNDMIHYIRLGQNSRLLKESANTQHLQEYSNLYVQMLGSLYGNLKAHEPIWLNGLIVQPFYFGDQPDPDAVYLGVGHQDALFRLIYDETQESLRTVRVVRYYSYNVVLIVKPDRLRYWIRSTAIRDADDTLVDLREQGWW